MNNNKNSANNLFRIIQFVLFVSSYSPLFILMIFSYVYKNSEYLYWSGFSLIGIKLFALKFGILSILFFVLIIAVFWYLLTLGKIEENVKKGNLVTVNNVKNRSSDDIRYIATYIIPFLFQSFNGWFGCFSVLLLIIIIYNIYINSTLLLINPLLCLKFGIYEIEYTKNKKHNAGIIISRDKYLQFDINIKIYEIGHRLYFAMKNN